MDNEIQDKYMDAVLAMLMDEYAARIARKTGADLILSI